MWIELHLQRLQFGLGQTLLQLRCLHLTFLVLQVVFDGVADANDDAINQHVENERCHQRVRKGCREDSGSGAIPLFYPCPQNHPGDRKDRAARQVYEERTPPAMLLDREPSGQPGGRDRQDCENIPICQRSSQGELPANRITRFGSGKVELAGKRYADDCPETEKQQPLTATLLCWG